MFLTHALRAIYRAAVVTGDSLWKYVSLLVSGTPPTVTFNSDASVINNVLTITGDTKPSNFNPYTPGYYSNYFDGTGDYLNVSNNTAFTFTSDFTIECWVYGVSYQQSNAAYPTIFSTSAYDSAGIGLKIQSSGGVGATGVACVWNNGSQILTGTTVISNNNWYHLAISRSGTSMKLFVNGVAENTITNSTTFTVLAGYPLIGGDTTIAGFLNGSISNLRIVKGTAVYTANFTPPTAPLTAIANTSLLTCQSNRFIDNSINNFAITKTGDVAVRGFVPFTPPTTVNVNTLYSTYFDGTGDYLSCSSSAAQFGTGAFTIECWIYPTSLAAIQVIADFRTTSTAIFGQIYLATNGTLHFYLPTDIATTNTVTLNTWNHIAISRSAGTLKMFINGTSGYSAADSGTYNAVGTYIGISISNTNGFTGYMSNMRFITGTGLYTANFTPPTANLTAISGTSLLTCQNATLVDNSTNAFAITSAGDARPIPVSPFTQVTTPVTATYLGSTYLDGTGDYLTTSGTYTFGTADFTIETWVYTTAYPGSLYAAIFGNITTVTGDTQVILSLNSSGNVVFLTWGTVMITTSAVVPLNAWVHIVAVRNGAAYKVYINGVLAGTSTTMYNLSTPGAANIGYAGLSGINNFTGYVSDMRVVQGTAVYTAAFTPPTAPLTAVSGTTLLTCQTDQPAANKQFVDNSGSNLLITQAGNTTQGTFSPYGANWSNYFDGTGDSLTVSSNAAFGMGTGDFTIEFWAYSTVNARQDWVDITDGTNRILVYYSGTNVTFYSVPPNGAAITGDAIVLNQWNHYAVSKVSGNTKLFINGTQSGSTYTTNQNYGSAAAVTIAKDSAGTTYVTGYMSNVRIIKGTGLYTSNFTPSTTPLTPVANTSLLTCQSGLIVDNSPNAFTITRNGDVSVQRFSPFSPVIQAPVSYSTYFDGSGDYLDLANNTVFSQTGSWTLEMWVYPTVAVNNYVYSQATANFLQINITGTNYVYIDRSGVGNLIVSTNPISLNVWTHLALVSDGTNMKLFINGTQSGSTAAVGTQATSAAVTRIGAYQATGSLAYQGYISNLRLVKGTAVYTSNFTVPTTPLTAVSGTGVLTCQSATIVDNSSNAFAITTTGDARARTQNPFGFTNTTTNTAYTPALYGGSAYFDGTGDTLNLAASAALPGAGDFTIDFWVNIPTAPTGGAYFTAFAYGSTGSVLRCFIFDSTGVKFGVWIGATQIVNVASTAMVGQWAHIGMSRKGTSFTFYINGVLIATVTDSTNYNTGTLYLASQAGASFLPGYISDFRIIKGQALYTGGFAPPVAPVQAVQNTVLLLNMDKAGATDSSRTADFETVGDTKIAYETPYAGSYYSNYFDGTGDYLTTPSSSALSFGTSNFTIEFWAYGTAAQGSTTHFLGNNLTYGANAWEIQWSNGAPSILNKLQLWAYNLNSSGVFMQGTTTLVPNQWYHIALVRNGTAFTLYLNGVSEATGTSSASLDTNSTNIIGVAARQGAEAFTGYISNVRAIKGTALYTSAFTPPTAPLTAVSGTSLLTCQSKSFVDNSTNAFTITRNGDTAVKSFNPFQKNTYSSMYFDGTGDYIIAPLSTKNAFGTGNFTAEMWLYPTAFANYKSLWGCSSGAASSTGFHTGLNASGNVFIYSASAFKVTTTNAMNLNAWNHVAFVRNGTALNIYINGVLGGTWTLTTQTFTDGYCWFGAAPGYASEYYTGYLADWRITNSQARYTATFTPPTAPLPTS